MVCVAEYLGQRTDLDVPVIHPVQLKTWILCPFMDSHCSKVSRGNEPVCSVRKTDGTLWITCEHRLCATKKNVFLTDHQKRILLAVAQTAFGKSIKSGDVFVKREAELVVTNDSKYSADYVLTLFNGQTNLPGPDRSILEMQGGGETSNTGALTKHIQKWRNATAQSNALLRKDVATVGTLETNAWRRQQEQFIIKGNIAMKTWKGYGLIFCVGSILFDYLKSRFEDAKLPDLRKHNWTLALIAFSEDTSRPPQKGPIPLRIDTNRLVFTNYQTFVQNLINQGQPSPSAFAGEFTGLDGSAKVIQKNG